MANDVELDTSAKEIDWDPAAWAQMVEAVNRLEAAWQARLRPDLAQFLPVELNSYRDYTLAELIKVDQECRWRNGERHFLESYLDHYPQLAVNPVILRELLQSECITRVACDVAPSNAELQSRFPQVTIDASAIIQELENEETNRHELLALTSEVCLAIETNRGEPTSNLMHPLSDNPRAPLDVGKSFGRFEIRAVLGHGSMGMVYRAYDPNLAREVAIKTPHFDSPQTQQEFLEEAQVAAKIRHPHICPIHEAGEIDGQQYIVFALIEGETLSARWRRCLPTPEQAAQTITKVAKALDCLHRSNIIHQDVKPQNVLIDQYDEPQLMDFGLASQASAAPDGFVGTPAYMPPEQLLGGAIDRRSDVFSLGVVLYEGLTGKLPFTGTPYEVMTQILSHQPASPQNLRPEIDDVLSAICLKAIAKGPIDRYQTAGEFAEALENRKKPEVVSTVASLTASSSRLIIVGATCLVGLLVGMWFLNPWRERFNSGLKSPITAQPIIRSLPPAVPDPGMDASTAIPIDLGAIGRACARGEVKARGKRQWFRVKSGRTGLLLLETLTPLDEFDGDMVVHDSTLKEIAVDGNSGPALDSQLVLPVTKDDVFFIAIMSTRGRLGPFLLVASQPATAPPGEPFINGPTLINDSFGDTVGQAHSFTFDGGHAAVAGSISPLDDEDWFTVTAPESGVLLLRPETPHSSLDTSLELYKEDVFLSSDRQRIVCDLSKGERYFIRLNGNTPRSGFSATGNYVLRFRLLTYDLVPPQLRNLEK